MTGTITQTLRALAAVAEGEVVLDLPKAFYTEECINAGRGAFAEYCTVDVMKIDSESIQVRVVVRDNHGQDSRDIVGGLLNYLLGSAAQQRSRCGSVPP